MRFKGLVTLERARLVRDAPAPVAAARGPAARRRSSPSISGGTSARPAGPAHEAVVGLLHRHGVAGATVLLGVDGTAARRAGGARASSARNARRAADGRRRRRAARRVAAALPELDALLRGRSSRSSACACASATASGCAAPHERRRHRPVRPRRVAEAHGLRGRAVAPRRGSALRPAGPRAARGGRRGRHQPARRLGLPRRPRAARRPASGSCGAACRSSPSSSTRPSGSATGSRSSTSSPTRPGWSRASSSPRSARRGAEREHGGLRLARRPD